VKSFNKFGHRAQPGGLTEDLVLVIDQSASMNSTDLKPSRMQAALDAGNALLGIKRKNYSADRVGIVSFSRDSQIVHPLSKIDGAFSSMQANLRQIQCKSSTNITGGLARAWQMLNPKIKVRQHNLLGTISKLVFSEGQAGNDKTSNGSAMRIILLSDGVHNYGKQPLALAEELKECGVHIHTVGIGGSPQAQDFDEAMLKRLASLNPKGKPDYCFITDTDSLIREFKGLAHHICPL